MLILYLKDWLYKTIPYFKDPKLGCSNPLGTSKPQLFGINKIQAFALDAHFTLEQVGRNSKLHFINFNGTAGVWRKQCILDGELESDTLRRFDLSYRAQLKLGIQI
jgi:cellulose synthase/poly-beta-1,6-N-acetylglucosamine synthase-like glycosyltransferase